LDYKGVQWYVAKTNYHQIRRQKEQARKARQLEKQQQKRAGDKPDEPLAANGPSDTAVMDPTAVPGPEGA